PSAHQKNTRDRSSRSSPSHPTKSFADSLQQSGCTTGPCPPTPGWVGAIKQTSCGSLGRMSGPAPFWESLAGYFPQRALPQGAPRAYTRDLPFDTSDATIRGSSGSSSLAAMLHLDALWKHTEPRFRDQDTWHVFPRRPEGGPKGRSAHAA